jgi:hypothetical protein
VVVNGERLTDASGWLLVRLPDVAVRAGAPYALSLLLQLSRDAADTVHLHAGALRLGSVEYPSVAALAAEGALWVRHLAEAVHAEIERRFVRSSRPTVSLRAVRPPPAPDEPRGDE